MTRWLRNYAGAWFGRWFGYVPDEDVSGHGKKPRRIDYEPQVIRYVDASATIECRSSLSARLFANVAIEAFIAAGSWLAAEFQKYAPVSVSAALRRTRMLEAEIGYTGRYQSDVDEEEAVLLALLMQADN
jgi:hypothetical protein